MNFADRLIGAIKTKGNPVCVGIDPRLEQIPAELIAKVTDGDVDLAAAGEVILAFGQGIVDAVADKVPAVKLQMAFYEQYGLPGMHAFSELASYAKSKGLVVIADGKRNDIGSTAEAYANAYLGEVDVFGNQQSLYDLDALTLTPYMGFDSVKPFTDACDKFGKGVFIMVKNSNPSAGDIQDRRGADNLSIAEFMAYFVESWGADLIGDTGFSSVGAVVGATYPQDLKKMRELMPNSIFLVPGYGAQGGKAADLRDGFTADGLGMLINSSRGIIYAYEQNKGMDYQEAASNAVDAMIDDLKQAVG